MPPKIWKVLLLLVTLIAASLRLWGLGDQSLWMDELDTYVITSAAHPSVMDVLKANLGTSFRAQNPPGYFVLMHAWQRALGSSELLLRLPSALCGIFAVPLLFNLGRGLYGVREGLVAAALLAVSPTAIYYSQEARVYSPLLVTILGATLLWIRVVSEMIAHREPAVPLLVGYTLAAFLLAYLHYFGVLVVVCQGFTLLAIGLARNLAVGRILTVYGALALSYVPWLYAASRLVGADSWQSPKSFGVWSREVFSFLYLGDFRVLRVRDATFVHPTVLAYAIVAILLAYAATRLHEWIRLARVPDQFRSDAVLAAWIILPFASAYAISVLWKPILVDRYMIILMPAAYLFIGRSLVHVSRSNINATILTMIVFGLSLKLLVLDSRYYERPVKEQYREAVELLANKVRNDERTFLVAAMGPPGEFDYYFERPANKKY